MITSRRQFLLFSLSIGRPLFGRQQPRWPAFRGPAGAGTAENFDLPVSWNADPDAGPLSGVLWKAAVPGLGHSSPIIWGDRLFVSTAVAASGKAPLRLGLYGDGNAARDNDEQSWDLLCFDTRSGKLLWKQVARQGRPRAERHEKATHANTTPVTDGRRLVAFFGSEGMYCYDLSGKLLWKKDLGIINVSKYGIGWGYASSPALHGGRVFLQCDAPDHPFVAAFRSRDGEELWRTSRMGACERSWGTPYVHVGPGGTQVVLNGWPFVASYDFETGREIWRLRAGGDNPVPTPFGGHGLIYVANGHGAQAPLYAVDPSARGDISLAKGETANKSVVWSAPQNGAYVSTPVLYQEYLYSVTNNGVLKCYDARTGSKAYEQRIGTGVAVSSSPVGSDGRIYCATEEGEVYVVRAGPKYEILSRNHMGEPCMATPALASGKMFFRTTSSLIAVGRG
jgi:outer membrane protein assembly factor BamB